jgi:mono/diheme cytochrome c family protein
VKVILGKARSISLSVTSVFAAAAIALAMNACGSDSNDSNNNNNTGGSTGDTAVARGKQAVASYACATCHQSSNSADGVLSGQTTPVAGTTTVYGPNLTPDMDTGLGSWTDDQIKAAIRTGVDDEGEMLCPQMMRYSTLSDSQVSDIVAYLRSIPAVHREIPESSCE